MKIKAILLSLLITFSGVILADFNDGLEAYNQGDYDTAFKEWSPYAEQGDADAQYNLALVYDFGYSDFNKAFEWYKKSAKQGRKDAQYNLALMYRDGDGTSKNYKKSIKWFKKSADQGYAKAQSSLGYAYRWGDRGVDKDYSKALYWTKKAAKQNDVIAQNNLAVAYEGGAGLKKDYKESIAWYLKAIDGDYEKAKENLKDLLLKMNKGVDPIYSEAVKSYKKGFYDEAFPKFLYLALEGGVKAQTYIGAMYAEGQWVGEDYQQANKWHLKAANEGYKVAQHNLGMSYEFGQGFSKDYKKAIKWYKKAIKQNFKDSQFRLGYLYNTGKGLVKDYNLAAKWYKKSANQGHVLAQYNLGLLYEYGDGVNKSSSQALKWYKKSADQGDEDAKAKVKKLIASQEVEITPSLKEANKDYDAEEYSIAFPKFLKLANQGDAEAQSFLAWMYFMGKGVDKNDTEAFNWFYKLSTKDSEWSAWAQNKLGYMYDLGVGVEENNYKAVKWYRKSANKGNDSAQYNLALMYQSGEGVDKSISTAIKWHKKSAEQGNEGAKTELEKLTESQGKSNDKYTVFSGSGTGFLVSKNGVFATNYHVIDGCGRIVVDEKDAKLVLQDKTNDLALIKVDKTYDKVSRLSYRSPALGSDVSVFGYPLSDMMSEKHISLTKGSVSSLAGMDGNLSNFRFTAPVQPGNSGGPIVSKEGKVVGITRAVLGKTVLEKGDFLPQNVNFGIRSSLLINMMESKMIPVNDTPLKVEDIVKHYVKTTKYIKCYE
jgi:TPR repeat protein